MSDLEALIADDLSKQMADSMDFVILAQLLGWTHVDMFYYAMGEVDTWLEKNCKFKYKRHTSLFMFEDENDANWFKLRWQ